MTLSTDLDMLRRLRDEHEQGHDAIVWSPEVVALLKSEADQVGRIIDALAPLAALTAEQIEYLAGEVEWMAEAHINPANGVHPIERFHAFVALATMLAKVRS